MSISKIIRTIFYSCYDLKKLDFSCNDSLGTVVSFTTVPQRINRIKPTIVSLMRQKMKPGSIEINLSEELFSGCKIPDFLTSIDCVKIFWQKNDYGPATKLIHTIERYKDTDKRIIIVDDDMYYSDNLISDLVDADDSSNGKQVFCINGFLISRNLMSESNGSGKALKSGKRRVAVVEGCGGYILRSSHLDYKKLLDITNAPHRSLFEDDIWFSGHLSRAGVEKIQIPTGRRMSLVNTVDSAIKGDRAQVQTDILQFFKNDWKPDEYEGESCSVSAQSP